MSSGFQEVDIVQETMKRVELNRRKAFRYNLLLILFLLLIMVGLFGAVWFFNELETKKAELKSANQQLDSLNALYQAATIKATKERANRDSIITQIYKPSDSLKIKGLDKIVSGIDNSRETAGKFARSGYMKLKNHDFKGALSDFSNSDKAYNGYRDSYEIYFLLWKNKERLDDPDAQREIMQTILRKYNSLRMISTSDIRR